MKGVGLFAIDVRPVVHSIFNDSEILETIISICQM